MSIFQFSVRNSQFPDDRGEGQLVTMNHNLSQCNPRTPSRVGSSTTSLSGDRGTTRVRGKTYDYQMVIPDIPWEMLPIMIDFAESMQYGYANPFLFNGTDMFGHYITFTAIVTDDKINLPNRWCKAWTASFNCREVRV
jgi:hypothetical protein